MGGGWGVLDTPAKNTADPSTSGISEEWPKEAKSPMGISMAQQFS